MKLKNIGKLALSKIVLATLLIGSPSQAAQSIGVGEYNFGPETAENTACEYAEEKARDSAILRFIGEQIESHTLKQCTEADCKFHNEVFRDVRGIIKKIIEREIQINEEIGHKNCTVMILAEVEQTKNNILFEVHGKTNYVDGEAVDFSFTSNRPGTVTAFFYHQNEYRKIYSVDLKENTETFLTPQKHEIVARLSDFKKQSKELMAFIFTENWEKLQNKYTANEMKSVVSSINPDKRKIIYRYVTIERKQ